MDSNDMKIFGGICALALVIIVSVVTTCFGTPERMCLSKNSIEATERCLAALGCEE